MTCEDPKISSIASEPDDFGYTYTSQANAISKGVGFLGSVRNPVLRQQACKEVT